jgi:hypothetical protein
MLDDAPETAVIMRPYRRLMHPGDQGRPARRADRAGNVGCVKDHAFACEPVYVGRFDQRLALITEMARHVLGNYPDDIWSYRLLFSETRRRAKKRKGTSTSGF